MEKLQENRSRIEDPSGSLAVTDKQFQLLLDVAKRLSSSSSFPESSSEEFGVSNFGDTFRFAGGAQFNVQMDDLKYCLENNVPIDLSDEWARKLLKTLETIEGTLDKVDEVLKEEDASKEQVLQAIEAVRGVFSQQIPKAG